MSAFAPWAWQLPFPTLASLHCRVALSRFAHNLRYLVAMLDEVLPLEMQQVSAGGSPDRFRLRCHLKARANMLHERLAPLAAPPVPPAPPPAPRIDLRSLGTARGSDMWSFLGAEEGWAKNMRSYGPTAAQSIELRIFQQVTAALLPRATALAEAADSLAKLSRIPPATKGGYPSVVYEVPGELSPHLLALAAAEVAQAALPLELQEGPEVAAGGLAALHTLVHICSRLLPVEAEAVVRILAFSSSFAPLRTWAAASEALSSEWKQAQARLVPRAMTASRNSGGQKPQEPAPVDGMTRAVLLALGALLPDTSLSSLLETSAADPGLHPAVLFLFKSGLSPLLALPNSDTGFPRASSLLQDIVSRPAFRHLHVRELSWE